MRFGSREKKRADASRRRRRDNARREKVEDVLMYAEDLLYADDG
jgi:hypothetical protein